jgi:hypothetical protein
MCTSSKFLNYPSGENPHHRRAAHLLTRLLCKYHHHHRHLKKKTGKMALVEIAERIIRAEESFIKVWCALK